MLNMINKQDAELSKDIENALETHQFQAFYQPQYDAVTGRLVSAEALARWIKPDGTVVPPINFIPCAEKSNLIMDIDWYILKEVCCFLRRRRENGLREVVIGVNFSRKHVDERDFVEKLCRTVDENGIERRLISVEITESAMMDNTEKIIKFVDSIRTQGFSVAIDDFGSGLSSLSLVKDISADILKIDQSLLSGNCENEKERIVLESIFSFANRLKLVTIAEGVETREQLGFLRTCDCRVIQGYLFAKPMPEKDFSKECDSENASEYDEDILKTQAPASVTNLLMEAVFTKFPLVIMSNLTRNSYYMMAYDNYSSTSCPSTGNYNELIAHAATTIHPEDRHIFEEEFSIEKHFEAYEEGKKFISAKLRQMGDDGVYHKVEMIDFLVKNPSVDDLLVITMSQNME